MTANTLKEYTVKDLAQMAKKRGITGWHSMRKSDLIQALVRDEKRRSRATSAKSNGRVRAAGAKAKVSQSKDGARTSTSTKGRSSAASTRGAGKSTTPGSKTHKAAAAGAKSQPSGRNKAGKTLTKATKSGGSSKAKSNGRQSNGRPTNGKPVAPQRLSAVARKIKKSQQAIEQLKDISGAPASVIVTAKPASKPAPQAVPAAPPVISGDGEESRDRVVLMVRDAYWLHVHWDLSPRSVQRAQAAMAEYWHTAQPIIRLMEITANGTTNATETFVRDIEIHGGVNNWYIDVHAPQRGYRVEIGYLGANDRFYGLARSNSVVTPEPGRRDAVDPMWSDVAQHCDRIFALSGGYSVEGSTDELQEVLEERLQRPVGGHPVNRFGFGADPRMERDDSFQLDVEAEMIIHGSTKPGARVTMGGEPVQLRTDGSFSVRMNLPDRRQVLPVTSTSADGIMEQTVVLAVERNTKVMEAVMRDGDD